ncbi:CDP-alcohol phosphatidyltransferase family protein [Patescibacteria group bacterium]|nr:CDP-alcohol phosphatidyltransferase family protein [Patescibacteria group bacterium]
MEKLIKILSQFLVKIHNYKEKWIQSKIKEYIDDFEKRAKKKKQYWFEKIADIIILPLIRKKIVNGPNLISIFRIILAIPIFIFVIDEHYIISLIFFISAMLLDVIDGPLARVLNQESELGAKLDPLGDKLVFAAVFLPLGFNWLAPWIFWTVLILELNMVFIFFMLTPLARRLNFGWRQKSTLPGKTKLFLQVIGCSFLILSCVLHVSKNMNVVASIFLVASIPFSVIAIISHLISIKKNTLK